METEDGTSNADNSELAEWDWCLKTKAVNNGVAIGCGNGVVNDEEVWGLKNGVVSDEEIWGFKNGTVNNEVAVAENKKVRRLQNGTVNNGVAIAEGFGVADGKTGGVECLRTYKRRKHVKSSSESKVQEDSRECVEAASHLSDQETVKIDNDGQECSSQIEWLSHRLQGEANGHANVMHNGCISEPDARGLTDKCRRVFRNILGSDKFSSLCKVLLENFQGMKPESVFDFSVINSRMREQAYEESPILFMSDIQQVWRKLQETGNEIVAITKSLSDISRASYSEQFCDQDSDFHMKPEHTEECARCKIGTCRSCRDKANVTDCLVCDSCEEMYHVSCIKPAVKEIPHKSWFCANCTAKGIGSPHEHCVVCERLNVPNILNFTGEESIPTNEETLNDLEENSDCIYNGIQVSIGGKNSPDCKICGKEVEGEKVKTCGHSLCPSKYYHVRCLSSKQLKSHARRWYCPSCICQVCLTDRDDDGIVLCDGCDHAYHIYCMKPPRSSVPRGKWFCRKCDAEIQAIRQAKKTHESSNWRTCENVSKPNDNLDKKWNRKHGHEIDKVGGMDMLLTAASTLNFEENLNAVQIEPQRT